MKMIETVRRALIAAGYARCDAQHSEDTKACATVTVERWMHFAKIGETHRKPMVIWHRRITGTDYEEMDVFSSIVAANDMNEVLGAISGTDGTQTVRMAAND